ncbi:hypothetical protein KUTeg_001946 [Tegillarca granosa]|uniref:HTH psq-type domain-containing protein n=1 Tax=Tegillarca granosa TaxID=220873 RepID=A0ABQ9FSW0_TEGGR|nr:hypothetical protein KUTeg_001946 [Tegillarca granosa]
MYSRKQNKKLKEAYSDVIQKNFKIRTAAILHGIPESTLRPRLASSNDSDIRRGGPTIFPKNQEQQLAEHCISMAHLAYGFARWQILDMAKNV